MNQSKELLRQQLELLAEHSEGATEQELPNLSAAMCEIYDRLIQEGVGRSLFRSAIILVTLSNLLVSMPFFRPAAPTGGYPARLRQGWQSSSRRAPAPMRRQGG